MEILRTCLASNSACTRASKPWLTFCHPAVTVCRWGPSGIAGRSLSWKPSRRQLCR